MSRDTTITDHAVWGVSAGQGPGHTIEAAAVRLADDIEELRADGALPRHLHTHITVFPRQRLLDIRVRGLSLRTDPDRAVIRTVTNTIFEVASYHNIAALDGGFLPLFTQRILIIDADGTPISGLIGTAVGDVKHLEQPPLPSSQDRSR